MDDDDDGDTLKAIKYTPASLPSKPASLQILHQLLLPHTTSYIPIHSVQDGHHAIQHMQVRGAPAIAIVAALSLAVELQQKLQQSHQQQQLQQQQQADDEQQTEAKRGEGKEKDSNLSLLTSAESTAGYIREKLAYLKTSRPTAVNLADAVKKLERVVDNVAELTANAKTNNDGDEDGDDADDGGGGTATATTTTATAEAVIRAYVQAAERMLIEDVETNKALGRNGARWIMENTIAGQKRRKKKEEDQAGAEGGELKILTHCNTGSLATAGFGTAIGIIRTCHQNGHLSHAFCTETRPYNQGSRLTAYELLHDQIPATLITDSMVGSLLAKEGDSIAAVVVGADRVAANGDAANKIGTYSLAILARHHEVKFLVAAPSTTIDLATASGEDIVIEERPPIEMTRVQGPIVNEDDHSVGEQPPMTVSLAPPDVKVWNPGFDVTPAALIDGIVTEIGVFERGADRLFDLSSIDSHAR